MAPELMVIVTFILAAAPLQVQAPATPALSPAKAPPDPQLLAELRTAQGQFTGPMALTYSGVYEIEGHLNRPHETMKAASELTVSIRNGAMAWDSRMTTT